MQRAILLIKLPHHASLKAFPHNTRRETYTHTDTVTSTAHALDLHFDNEPHLRHTETDRQTTKTQPLEKHTHTHSIPLAGTINMDKCMVTWNMYVCTLFSTQLCSKQVKAYEVVRGQFDLDKVAPHQMHTQTPLSLSLYLPLHIIYT